MRRTFTSCSLLLLANGFAACGFDASEPADEASNVQATDRDLTVGAVGSDVKAVHAYLERYGYLPNAELTRTYPAWRPIMNSSPARSDAYDENTAEAVRALQRNARLEQTGIVDVATRALLAKPRCGVPDGIPDTEENYKFALGATAWNKTALTWKVLNTNDVTQAQAEAAVQAAFNSWTGPTQYTFTKQTGAAAADIQITFSSKDGNGSTFPANTYGSTFFPGDGGDMWLNTARAWSVATPTVAGDDLEAVVVHELGHALGL